MYPGLFIFILSAALLACATVETAPLGGGDFTRRSSASRESSASNADPDDTGLPNEGDKDDDDSYGGFCNDDLYSDYLRKEFFEKESRQLESLPPKEHRKALRKLAAKAQYYAHTVLLGPTKPYFGGVPVVATPGVEAWVHYYKTRGRELFIKWMVRGEIYKTLVLNGLHQEGLPPELFYLAMIESGFSNTASSKASATGTWQFMKGTAQHYGLKMNYWVDERRDPVKSTVAAARFLRDLYARFGDWYLAMAAYNAGPGKINRAVRNTHSRDFWALTQTSYISRETKQYVPKMLAALIISTDPEAHGFKLSQVSSIATGLTSVPIMKPTHLHAIATKIGISFIELKRWNPELIRNVTPPHSSTDPDKPYQLRIPSTYATRFFDLKDSISYLDVKDVTLHQIQKGETLGELARHYAVPIEEILALNPELRPQRLSIGRTIAIPIPEVIAHL